MTAPPVFRFLILGLTTLCLTCVLSNMSIYNFTKICLEPHDQDPLSLNATRLDSKFSDGEKTLLKGASAIGSMAAGLPMTYFFKRFSARRVFLSAGLISAAATLTIPLAFNGGFTFIFIARIVQGVALSANFYFQGFATSEWAPLNEHGLFLAFLTGFTQLSNIFTMPVSGAVCSSSLGWSAVYYLHAAITVVCFAVWAVVFRDRPSDHPAIGKAELEMIMEGRNEGGTAEAEPTPYLAIIKDRSVIAVLLAAFADMLYVQLVAQYEPVYFNDFLQFDVMNSGIISALPLVAQFAMKLIAGLGSDAVKCFSPTTNVRIGNSIALFTSGIGLIAVAFIPRQQQVMAVVGLAISVSFTGFVTAGFNKCATLRARQHSHFVMILIGYLWAIAILLEPFIVDSILTNHGSQSQWQIIFISHGTFAIVANVAYIILADARPAPWTQRTPSANEFVHDKTCPPPYSRPEIEKSYKL